MTANNETMLNAALRYASVYGIRVFPLRPNDKRPATKHGLKDATTDLEQIREWWTERPFCGVGGVMGNGIVAIDVDKDDDKGYDASDWLAHFEHEHGKLPETATSITGRGGVHMLYRTTNTYHPSANPAFHIDIRCEGSYVVLPPSIHPNGNEYFWDLDPDDVGIAWEDETVRQLIATVQGAAPEPSTAAEQAIEAGGRNETLYHLALSLRSSGLDVESIRAALYVENRNRCRPPLPEYEVRKIAESACTKPAGHSEEVKAQEAARTSKIPNHVVVGQTVISKHSVCFIDGIPAARNGDIYTTGWDAVDKAMIMEFPEIKIVQRREARAWLNLNMPTRQRSSYKLIGFRNGVYDIDKPLELRPYREDDVIINQIPHDYDPDAYSADFDHFLERVSCGDDATFDNLKEVMGLCIMSTGRFGLCPVLIGDGSNGKSTYIEMLKNLLGRDNISALQPADIGRRFQASMLVGKLANLGDDISNDFLGGEECAQIKKVATGNEIYTDVKNGIGYTFQPYCTMVFSANSFPRINDSTFGMLRRFFPIQFNARFSPSDPDYNPDIIELLTSEEVMTAACGVAIQGADAIVHNKTMTANETSKVILQAIKEENNSVYAWLVDQSITKSDLIGQVVAYAYEQYNDWCVEANSKPLARGNFTKNINALYRLRSVAQRDEQGVSRKTFVA